MASSDPLHFWHRLPPAWRRVGQRWRTVDDRGLWFGVSVMAALYLLILNGLTQPLDERLNLLVVLGGVALMKPSLSPHWQPRPGRRSRWLGVALLLAVLWCGQRILGFDFFSSLLPLLTGLGLALLAAPIHELRRFWQAFAILLLLPLLRLLWWAVPTDPFQRASAWIAQQALIVCGYPAVRQGLTVSIPGSSVTVAELCAGINSMLLLFAVSVIFALLFPMRRPWQNLLMALLAPVLALVVNGVRVGVLALILGSGLPNRDWWFEFFHFEWGSYVFSVIAMQLFLWCYVGWLERQVARVEAR